MDEKISLEAIALYSDAYAEKVLKKTFATNQKIEGKEILSLCDVQQINLFIVRELFKAWKEEFKKLKSPYFDYDHPNVKEALENFMSVLSKNISISRQHFAPMLKKAVSQTVLLVLDPYDYFSMIISGSNNKLDVNSFREEIKYLKINKAPLEKLLERLDEKNIKEITGNEAFAILDQILEEVNFSPEDVDDYIRQFSVVEVLSPEKFYFKKIEPEKPASPKSQAQKPVLVDAPVAAKPSVDNFKKIQRIKERLTINQKFMFTKVLFGGDFESFSRTIDELDQQQNITSALQYLEKLYRDWDKESEEFHEFMEMVEKRFS
jgi:PHD/YefM family antitoxin component YafN of YafNO toxin-antitoxin module